MGDLDILWYINTLFFICLIFAPWIVFDFALAFFKLLFTKKASRCSQICHKHSMPDHGSPMKAIYYKRQNAQIAWQWQPLPVNQQLNMKALADIESYPGRSWFRTLLVTFVYSLRTCPWNPWNYTSNGNVLNNRGNIFLESRNLPFFVGFGASFVNCIIKHG